jgi:hypothetical protein
MATDRQGVEIQSTTHSDQQAISTCPEHQCRLSRTCEQQVCSRPESDFVKPQTGVGECRPGSEMNERPYFFFVALACFFVFSFSG